MQKIARERNLVRGTLKGKRTSKKKKARFVLNQTIDLPRIPRDNSTTIIYGQVGG
jgi:hypothetical protein